MNGEAAKITIASVAKRRTLRGVVTPAGRGAAVGEVREVREVRTTLQLPVLQEAVMVEIVCLEH